MIERELKFEAGGEVALPDLTALVPGGQVTALEPRRLEATYFDTSDLRLARWGVTLRHRSEAPGRAVWTVKLSAPGDKGAGERARREVDFPAADGPTKMPDDVAFLVGAFARTETLQPVARLKTRRVRFALSDADGVPVAEIDDDYVVAYQRNRLVGRFREIEVELDPAAPEELAKIVVKEVRRAFRKAGAAPARQPNKLLRVIGSDPEALLPEISSTGAGGSSTAGELLQAALLSGTRRLLQSDPVVRLDGDVEGLHQLRVATRRLRSDLGTFAPFAEPSSASELRDELRWLGGLLGSVRDADVLGQRLRLRIAGLPVDDAKAAQRALVVLSAQREAARNDLVEAMATERYVCLLENLVATARSPSLTEAAAQDGKAVILRVVAKRWRKVKKMATDTNAQDDAALHAVRIAAKRARYAAEAGIPVLGRRARTLAKALGNVQDVLGEVHDAWVAEAWLRGLAVSAPASKITRTTALALGELVAAERSAAVAGRQAWPAAWAAAERAWRDFGA